MSMLFAEKQGRFKRTRGRLWVRLRNRILTEQPVCTICGARPSEEVDHIIPVSKGGTDESDNLQGACKRCHEEKTRNDLGLKKEAVQISVSGYPIKKE